MIRTILGEAVETVTTHNRAVVLVALLLTAGMVVGAANAEMGGEGDFGGAVDTAVDEKDAYIDERYGADPESDESSAQFPVYVREEGGNALSKDALLATLRYQRTVADEEAVAEARTDDEPSSIASLVGARAAGDPDASTDERIAALEAADGGEVASLVRATIEADHRTRFLLPDSYEPGSASAESTQVVFAFEPDAEGQPPSDAQTALYEAAQDREGPEFFTLGEAATDDQVETNVENTVFLVLPIVLALIVGVAAFAYRDLVDVAVGITGVLVSIVWMFGVLGWLGIDVGPAVVIGPVLIAGLSIDYGFHVFMRYREEREAERSGASNVQTESEANREQRGTLCVPNKRTGNGVNREQREAGGTDESIRAPMARGLRSVAVAFALVTATAGIGFLANLANPVGMLRDLGVAITLGVVAAFLVFVTLVPALKITVDGALERFGIDRRKHPLGDGRYLRPVLVSTVTLARRAAPVVIVAALVLAAAGAAAWTALDEETMQAPDGDVAEWKRGLPGPVGWEENEVTKNRAYVGEQFRTAATGEDERVQILVEGEVTDGDALYAVEAGVDEGVARGAFAEGRTETIRTPTTVIREVADEDDEFAAAVAAADANGDGVPDSALETVYDRLYEVAPERASDVIERTEGGEYRSLRVIGPPEAADGQQVDGDRAESLFAVGDAIEAENGDLTATVVSDATAEGAAIERITDGIVQVMAVAVLAVVLALVAIYRRVHGSATLGAVTAGPIALVLGFVVGGMYLLSVPLTFLTALLVSLVIGVGVDYTIHVSDRFARELERGRTTVEALEAAVTGTGGALLGSALTSVAAFAGMLIHPSPGFENFATLVVLALVAAFATSVIVLPSLLYVWARRVATPGADVDSQSDVAVSSGD